MDLLTDFVAPIAGLWVIHNAIFSSAGFVNKMRETVITGVYEKEKITHEHQKAIFIDWMLCMAATIFVCIIFAGIVLAASFSLSSNALLRWTGVAIAVYPLICSMLFGVCAISDAKLMRQAIARTSGSTT